MIKIFCLLVVSNNTLYLMKELLIKQNKLKTVYNNNGFSRQILLLSERTFQLFFITLYLLFFLVAYAVILITCLCFFFNDFCRLLIFINFNLNYNKFYIICTKVCFVKKFNNFIYLGFSSYSYLSTFIKVRNHILHYCSNIFKTKQKGGDDENRCCIVYPKNRIHYDANKND